MFSGWNLDVTNIGTTGGVVGIARKVSASEEWQRVMTCPYKG